MELSTSDFYFSKPQRKEVFGTELTIVVIVSKEFWDKEGRLEENAEHVAFVEGLGVDFLQHTDSGVFVPVYDYSIINLTVQLLDIGFTLNNDIIKCLGEDNNAEDC